MCRRRRKCFRSARIQFTSNEHFVEDTGHWGFMMLCHWFKQSKNNYSWTSWPLQMKALCSLKTWEPLTEQHSITSQKTWIFNNTSLKTSDLRDILFTAHWSYACETEDPTSWIFSVRSSSLWGILLYNHFFYSNSCTLLHTLKTPIHINT